MAAELYLDTLPAKQRAKELKAVGKAVKNKDEAIRLEALQKLADDPRYVTEGGCIMPLLEIMVPKKKTLEFTETAVEAFATFLRPEPKESAEGEEAAAASQTVESSWAQSIAGLQTIKALTSNLDALKVLSELMVYKDNVKPQKSPKVKKGETPPPPPPPPVDSQLSISLRRNSLKSVFYIAEALINSPNTEELRIMFAEIENLSSNLCGTISRLANILLAPTAAAEEGEEAEPTPEPELTEEELAAKDAAMAAAEEECEWALIALALLVDTSENACRTVLNSDAADSLPALTQLKPAFTLPILKALLALSKQDSDDTPGLAYVTAKEVFSILIDTTASTSEILGSSEAGENDSNEANDPLQLSMSHLDVLVATLTHVATMQRAFPERIVALDLPCLDSLVPAINTAIMSQRVWKLARSSDSALTGFVSRCCALIGVIAEVDAGLRRALSFYPTASTLLSLLRASKEVIGDVLLPSCIPSDEDSEETSTLKENANVAARASYVSSLRRAAEKALLTILSIDNDSSGELGNRWESCEKHKTDSLLFVEYAATEEGAPEEGGEASGEEAQPASDSPRATMAFPVEELLSLLNVVGEDDELADRATRILAALVLGSSDSIAFASDRLQINPDAVTKLGAVILARATSVVKANLEGASKALEDGCAKASSESHAADTEAANENEGALREDEGAEASGENPVPAFVPPTPAPLDLTVPTAKEVLYLGLALAECAIAGGAEQVQAFASEEIVLALAHTVCTSGPTSINKNVSETEASLYDARDMPWDPSADSPDAKYSCLNAYIRPLCLDVLVQIMASNEKFRVYEPLDGEEEPPTFPLAPGVEVPSSTSPTEECALRVCRLAADGIIATLTTEVTYAHNGSATMEIYADPADTLKGALEPSVLKAALEAAASITSCGHQGLEMALQALADAGLKETTTGDEGTTAVPMGAAKHLVSYLETITAPAPIREDMPASEEKACDGDEGIEEQKGEDVATALTVSDALANFSWALPDSFSDIIKEGLPTGARNLLQQPVLWPFLTFLGPALSVLRNASFDTETARLALRVIKGACISKLHASSTQPVCYNVFCATSVSAGGAVALTGAGGAFGSLSDSSDKEETMEIACQVVSRGFHSEEYWRVQHAPPAGDGEDAEPAADVEDLPPYTGPSELLWGAMLRLAVHDFHLQCPGSLAITSALQGALHTLSVDLVARGSDINAKDSFGRSALMYALVMRDEQAFQAIMGAGPNLELTDTEGNPISKYALISLPEAEVAALTVGKQRDDRACLGSGVFASEVFRAGADVNSADTDGNSVLQLAVGLAAVDMTIGGVKLQLSSAAYVDETICSRETTYKLCDQLLASGSKVNTCNKNGTTALHIVAARGHTELINLFLHYNLAPCIEDMGGMLPLHYTAACCPTNFVETFCLVMKISVNRSLLRGTFDDERLKIDKEARAMYDIDKAFDEVFAGSLVPSCIAERRLSRGDLLSHLTVDGKSLFQLLLAGHVLADGHHTPFINTSPETKAERLRAAIYLCTEFLTEEMSASPETLPGMVRDMVGRGSSKNGFNSMHAACLLLQGVSERVPLTPAQKRSKRVRSYESAELHVLDLVSSVDADAGTTQAVNSAAGRPIVESDTEGEASVWTPLHAAMWADNHPLVLSLIQQCDLSKPQFSTIAFSMVPLGAVSEQMLNTVISGLSDTPVWATLLSPNLLGAAVDKGNASLISALIAEPKVNPNAIIGEGVAQRTALHMAVEIAATAGSESSSDAASVKGLPLVKAFEVSADRLDMCVEDAYGNTCIDTAVASRSLELVTLLLSMRKNDVIERILMSRNGGPSLLFELEEENMQKAKDAGFYIGEEPDSDMAAAAASIAPEGAGDGETASVKDAIEVAGEEADKLVPEEDSGGAVEIEVIDSAETNVASYNPTTEADLEALKASNGLVKVLIDAVSDIVAAECHCHKSYAEGMTYSQYVQSRM